MKRSLIVALAENRVIGRDGDLPWRLSSDLKRFKRLTMGHHIVMGRKTFDSIGRPLPGRKMIVLSRDASLSLPHVAIAQTLESAFEIAKPDNEVFVIGGAQIYELALPLTSRLYLTRVHATVDGDTFFPALDPRDWEVVEETTQPADDRNDHACTYQVLQRRM